MDRIFLLAALYPFIGNLVSNPAGPQHSRSYILSTLYIHVPFLSTEQPETRTLAWAGALNIDPIIINRDEHDGQDFSIGSLISCSLGTLFRTRRAAAPLGVARFARQSSPLPQTPTAAWLRRDIPESHTPPLFHPGPRGPRAQPTAARSRRRPLGPRCPHQRSTAGSAGAPKSFNTWARWGPQPTRCRAVW